MNYREIPYRTRKDVKYVEPEYLTKYNEINNGRYTVREKNLRFGTLIKDMAHGKLKSKWETTTAFIFYF